MPRNLKDTYLQKSDEELIDLFLIDFHNLNEEAQGTLEEVLRERDLHEKVTFLQGLYENLSDEQLQRYAQALSALPCPSCNGTDEALTAGFSSAAFSILVFTNYEKRFLISCPTCLRKRTTRATVSSLLFGWWGIPWGPIRTIQALVNNAKVSQYLPNHEPNEWLQAFALQNLHRIELGKDEPQRLRDLIR